MTSITQQFWTKSLVANSLTIDETFGLTGLSIVCVTGDVFVRGNLIAGGISYDPIKLVVGMPMNILSDSNTIISGIDIDSNAGRTLLLGMQ
jgi:hypothetical protein